jgi:NtrC-family two-component system sensor histidine kinase KinB
MTLRNRLLLSFGAILAIVLVGYGVMVVGVIALGGTPQRIVDQHYSSIRAAESMRQAVLAQQDSILRKLLDANMDMPGELEAAHTSFTSWLARAKTNVGGLEESETLAHIEERYRLLQEVIADQARWASTYPWETDVVDAFRSVTRACEALAALNADSMVEVSRTAYERMLETLGMATGVVAAVLLVGVGVSVSLARRLSQPLERMVEGARRIANGDYQVKVPEASIQEVGHLAHQFNVMAEALGKLRAMDLERVINEQRQSEAVLQSIDDGLVIFEQNATVKRLNPVAALQLGIPVEASVGRTLTELLDDPNLDADVHRGLEGEDGIGRELVFGVETGRRYLGYSIVPIDTGDNHCQGAVMVIRDITEHKAFDQLRTEFVLKASHELRTPVTSIRMGLGILTEKRPFAEESRERELLVTVNEELDRLMRLVNDLFDLSRLRAGYQGLDLETYDVQELLQAAQQRFAFNAAQHGVCITLGNIPVVAQVRVDRTQFDRILDNLLNNGLRHTPAGGRIMLQARRSGHWVLLEVCDTGVGIDYAQQRRVFEPFVQVGDNSGGTGLGLALCQEIAHYHGGAISLRSAPGRGAKFCIKLPSG